jgi:hypothetical protein
MQIRIWCAVLVLMTTHSAYAASPTLRESHDCPLAWPFTPEANPRNGSAKEGVSYSMQGYKISRIEISADKPVHLELIWTPVDAKWGEKTAQVSVTSGNPQCFLSSFPVNTAAKHIEIRSDIPLEKLAVSFSDVPWDDEGTCPAKRECPVLVKTMHECKADPHEASCRGFMESLHQLTPRAHCRRAFDTDPVPAIWLCDEITQQTGTLGEAMYLLKSLKFKKAVDYYKSAEFRSVLDGAYAEEYEGL